MVGLVNHTPHVLFVVFIRAVDVEKLQSSNLVKKPVLLGVAVEHVLRVAIHV